MPRSGPLNLYSLPPIYLAVPGTPIIVDQHNTPLEDIADTFNEAWPVNFGGTGGTSPITAWDAINVKGTDIPTAATVDLTLATGPNLHFTGTTTVSTVSLADGAMRFVIADAAFQLTASSTLVVNGSTTANMITAAGDLLVFIGGAASVTRVWSLGGASTGALYGYTTTVTAAVTTTLTATSTYQQFFTGTTTQTVQMPVTSTLTLGHAWRIVNNSTGVVTVNSSGGNAIVAMAAGTVALVTCILLTGTTAASWSVTYVPATSNANSNTLNTGNGTVALPAFSFASDPDTGIYRIAANSFGVAAGGVLGISVTTTAGLSNVDISPTGDVTSTAGGQWSIGAPQTTIQSSGASGTAIAANGGNLTLNATAASTVILTNGRLTFPATQNPSSNANTLDDYEEGTWTPTFAASGSTFSYAFQAGSYVKIGQEVCVSAQINLNTSGNTLTGNKLTVAGFPFTAANYNHVTSVGWFNSTSSFVCVQVRFANSAAADIWGITAGATTGAVDVNANTMLHATNGSILMFSLPYRATA